MKSLYQSLLALCCVLTSSFSFAQVPVYSSYPSAEAVLFLDFDGHLVQGTSWNSGGAIHCGPANLTDAQITEIFNRVAEDYRPFNINVTTDSTKFLAAVAWKRMRVILTVTSEWYGSAGGVSWMNSFSWFDNTPCFVFTSLLGYNQKSIAEAAAHEAGHTLGLRHQSSYNASCVKTAEYHSGVGTGEIGWAPIMGVGYYRNLTLWNNGTDPSGCNSYQDDLGIITSGMNGFSYRVDDHANNVDASASSTTFTGNSFNVNGVIERMTDKDVFQFTIPQVGQFHLDAVPYNTGTGNSGSNLDIQLEILNNTGTVIGVYNPENMLNLSLDTMLLPGTYYLRVQGKGNVYAPEYASLGSYSLSSTFTPSAPLPLRKLELSGSVQNKQHRFSWFIDADEAVTEQMIEVSGNGRDYHAIGNLSADARNFQYTPAAGGNLYYRMNVLFDNGRRHYSNIVSLKNINAQAPKLATNMVSASVAVNSPSAFQYQVVDINGRLMAKGMLVQGMNQINSSSWSSGMYIIRFANGLEQYQERMMKQ